MASNLTPLIMSRLNAKNPDIGSLTCMPWAPCAILVAPLLISLRLKGQPTTEPTLMYRDATTKSHLGFWSSSSMCGIVWGGWEKSPSMTTTMSPHADWTPASIAELRPSLVGRRMTLTWSWLFSAYLLAVSPVPSGESSSTTIISAAILAGSTLAIESSILMMFFDSLYVGTTTESGSLRGFSSSSCLGKSNALQFIGWGIKFLIKYLS